MVQARQGYSAGEKPEGNWKSPFTAHPERPQRSACAGVAEAEAEPHEEPCRHPPGVCVLQAHEVNTTATCRTNGLSAGSTRAD